MSDKKDAELSKAESVRRFQEACRRLDTIPVEQKIELIEQAMEKGDIPVPAKPAGS